MRPGIVDLRDLVKRYAWEPRSIGRFIRAAELVVDGEMRRGFSPPRVLVLIVPYTNPEMVHRAQPWIVEATRVVIVRDGSADPAVRDDPELRELQEMEWQPVLAELPGAEVFDWYTDDAVCLEAVQHAIAACAELGPLPARESVAPVRPEIELPASTWVAYETDDSYRDSVTLFMADRIDVRSDPIALLADAAGARIDLSSLVEPIRISRRWPPPVRPANRRTAFRPLGFDPIHPVGWTGIRMFFFWSYVGRSDVGFLSASDHDFPCGPAKKLYGYADNEPVQIHLAPAADVCLARFEHDVLITSAVPIPWHRAGEVDVAVFPPDPARAVFFAQYPDGPHTRDAAIDLLDEDARDRGPAAVLGPDPRARYALDLGDKVFRIVRRPGRDRDEDDRDVYEVAHVGGPEGGYGVFDAEHRVVRCAKGRLLGGWFRWATIEDAGYFWREDLATGERASLGPVDATVCDDPEIEAIARDAIREGRYEDAARIRASHPSHVLEGVADFDVVAIPGSRNVLLVADRFLRIL